MSLRIIGGQWKGRRIEAPPGKATRPLLDRIKQSLFDWLGGDFSDLTIADICAGSGNFGIETASRGAKKVHLMEPHPVAIETIRKNLKSIGSPTNIQLHTKKFQQVLPDLENIDLLFADPPFPWLAEARDQLDAMLADAAQSIHTNGLIIMRGEKGYAIPTVPEGCFIEEERSYGRSWIITVRHKTP